MKKILALVFIILIMFCQVCSALYKLDPNRWEPYDEGRNGELWFDKSKLYFYKQNGNNYADVWTMLRNGPSGSVILSHEKIYLDTREIQTLEDAIYKGDGTVLKGLKSIPYSPIEKITSNIPPASLFKKVYAIYEPISKREDRDKIFAELKAKADSIAVYTPPRSDFIYIDPESDRWYRNDGGNEWIDAQKLWFFKENGDVYANVWTISQGSPPVVVHNLKFNLNKNEEQVLRGVLYDVDGSQEGPWGPTDGGKVEKPGEATYSAVYKIYNAINDRKDRDKIFAELKAEAFGTNPYNPQVRDTSKANTPVLVKYNIIPSHHKFLDPDIMIVGVVGIGICIIIVLIGMYFYKRKENKPAAKISENGEISQTKANQQISNITLDDIPKLKKMLDDGVITQEEFDAAKKKFF